MALEVIVLAAGQGTRMRSQRPKVVHEIGGRPMLGHVLDTARALSPERLHVVVGAGADQIRQRFLDAADVAWVEQPEQLGSGHAVLQAMPGVSDGATVLVLYADVPLVGTATLEACVAASRASGGVALVTAEAPCPDGLGRIVRDAEGGVAAVVEDRDATDAQRGLTEINTGILAAPGAPLAQLLARVGNDNAQREYYLTDVIAEAVADGVPVAGVPAADPEEVLGVNDRIQLAEAERRYQRRNADSAMRAGVTLRDPARFDLRGTLRAGLDCVIDVGVVLEGSVELGADVQVGAHCVIRDSVLADGVTVEPHTVIDGARIDRGAAVGPFARLRPGTELGEDTRIGNFVETKKARLGAGTKASHLAYLGDAFVGERCNVGAGTITCNYDGVDKHETRIGDEVFVGTNTTLVAPLEVEDGAYIGAGSTITTRVAAEDLAVGRARQRNIKGWKPPAKRKR